MRGIEVAKKTIVKVWRFVFGDNRKPKPYEMYNRMNKISAPSYRKMIENKVTCVKNWALDSSFEIIIKNYKKTI